METEKGTIERAGRTFRVVMETKGKDRSWKIMFDDFRCAHGKTRKACLSSFEEKDEEDLVKNLEIAENILNMDKTCKAHRKWFVQTFLFQPPFCVLHRMIYRGRLQLDVVKMDHLLRVPDGTSTKEHIRNKYGQAALEKVMAMAGISD